MQLFFWQKGAYLGLVPLRESPAGFFMWICKAKIWQKAKRDLQEAPTLRSILLVVTLCWSGNFLIQPTENLGLVDSSPELSVVPFALEVCLRNLLWKGSKDLQISRLMSLFLASSTLLCIGLKNKDHRKIFFDQKQHHIVILVPLHSIIQKEPLYRGRKFYNDCLQGFPTIRTHDLQGLFGWLWKVFHLSCYRGSSVTHCLRYNNDFCQTNFPQRRAFSVNKSLTVKQDWFAVQERTEFTAANASWNSSVTWDSKHQCKCNFCNLIILSPFTVYKKNNYFLLFRSLFVYKCC